MVYLCPGLVTIQVPFHDARFADCSFRVGGYDFGVDSGTLASPGTSVPLLFSDRILGNNLNHTSPGGTRTSFGRGRTGIFHLVRISPLVGIDILLAADPHGGLSVLPVPLAD